MVGLDASIDANLYDRFWGTIQAPMSDLNGTTLDHYEILDQIGRGGMATVYRAVDKRDGREVAIKVLAPGIGADRRFIKRFRREASLVSTLKHPNIVPVLEYGQSGGFVYTAMPFVSGETLHAHIVGGAITSHQNVRWVDQISKALGFAHEHGVIHRDVKPSNIIISETGDALLTDFGLARDIEGHSSLTGSMLMGTPAYISPEQGRGEDLDERSDQYSLGIILYEMATGRLPFDTDSPMATVMAHIQEPVPRPRRFNPDLAPEVEAVILKSLAKKRDLRFETILGMNDAYQAAMAGEPIPTFDVPPSVPPTQVKAAVRPLRAQPTVYDVQPRRRTSSRWVGVAVLVGAIGIGAIIVGMLFGGGLLGASSQPGGVVGPTLPPTSTEGVLVLASSTPPPATVQPTAVVDASCPGLSLAPLGINGNNAEWIIDNGGARTYLLENVELQDWPLANGELNAIFFGDTKLYEIGQDSNMLTTAPEMRSLESGFAKKLVFSFEFVAGHGSYTFDLRFDGDCVIGIDG